MRALDTTPEAAALQEQAYRELGPAGRLRIALDLRLHARARRRGHPDRHPEYSEEMARRKLAAAARL